MAPLTRRQFLGAAAGVSLSGGGLALPAAGLTINPRSAWATNHPPKGPIVGEDVRFLLVHHSASRNGHEAGQVPGILREWYEFHTGPEKGWSDIAYNFVIDSEGGIWEARQGSLAGAVAGDATGGNQGFSQLVCVIGDYNEAHPTQVSLRSLARLLAWLADRYDLSTSPGSEVSFISRGSNLWPKGTEVTTPTITGHRKMSKTTCPGDNLFSYVAGDLMADVDVVRRGGAPPAAPTTTTPPTTTTTTTSPTTTTTTRPTTTTTAAGSTTTSTAPPTTTTAPTTTSTTPPTSTTPTTTSTTPPTTTPALSTGSAVANEVAGGGGGRTLGLAASAMLLAGVGLAVWRWRRLGG